jgi:hypothetical protein
LEAAGVAITLPAEWRKEAPRAVLVPGELLGAWKGPEGESVVVYQTLPNPGADAKTLGAELVNRLGNLPECHVIGRNVIKVGDASAARVEVVAPGTGHALAASGMGVPKAPNYATLVPTRQVSIAVPRGRDTLWVVWHYPEAAKGRMASVVDNTLKTLQIQSSQSSYTSSY